MIYHLIDSLKYSVSERVTDGHAWVDFRNYVPNDTTALVKDMVDSDNFLRVVIKQHNPQKRRLFHIFQMMHGDKYFFITDAALNMFPTPAERLSFACQAADWCMAHGQMTPDDIVWFLNHSGHYNPKNPTSAESESLRAEYMKIGKTACACGQLDVALSIKSRQIKYGSDEPRDAKMIIVNDINEGNSIIKSFMLNGWTGCGFVIGADVPVVLNSRSGLDMNDAALRSLGIDK